ncbi:peptidase M28 [Anopheles sinensis]|uniref:Peptidase M28 n=1 Tax=Anopheles sinensis TaxID=74873 RepID=A0A084WB36_ANOSI|nr:peptidase M28 [Anopheles sinensis]
MTAWDQGEGEPEPSVRQIKSLKPSSGWVKRALTATQLHQSADDTPDTRPPASTPAHRRSPSET